MDPSPKTIQLKDGRTLAYAEYGLPDGKPVFFFHGSPGSRLFQPPEEITKKVGVRLICTDRPGYGLSTFQPGRRYLDWPKDIAQLADALGIQRFFVSGHSGGGPHAQVCAHSLPERVMAGALLCGAGPVAAPGAREGMTALNRFGSTIGGYTPWPVWRLLVWVFDHRRAEDPAADIDRNAAIRPAADNAVFARPDVREACIQSEVEAFRPGLKGLAWDLRLVVNPWDFRPEDIRVPIHLWHGTTDDQTPLSMARYLAGRIPDSHLHVCEGEAHMLLVPHWEEILTTLTNHKS